MSEWKEYKLEDIIDKFIDYRGKTPKKSDAGIPLVTAKVVKAGRILAPNEFIPEEEYDNWMIRGYPQKNDVVLTTEAPLGEVALIKDENIALAQRIITMRGKPDIVSNVFLKYYLQSDQGQYELDSRASGTTVFGIKASVLRKLPVLLPELPEQHAISSVLSSLDDKIDLLHRQNQTLEQMAETLFRQWFVEEADEGWEWRQLDEFIEVQRGLSYKGVGLTDADDGVPMHNLNSIYEGGGYKEVGIKYYNGEFKERHKVFPGDVIVTNTEQGHEHLLIGYPAIVPANFGEYGIFSQHIYRLEIKSKLSNFFLFHLLKTHDVHEQIAGATNGSTVNMLSRDGVEWVKFRMPLQKLIDDFTHIANDHFKKQELNQTQIRTLTALRDTLLPKLLSGEVKIKF
jgi:type I restriction enzyme S subunit